MIDIILSGEGNSDIGERDYGSGEFVPGPISYLTMNLLRFFHKHDVNLHFKSRSELKRHPITLKGKKKKFKNMTTGKGHANLAFKLGYIAKKKRSHIAVLMRDSGRHEFKSVYIAIKDGFQAAKFEHGVPAVPVPESEAWLICCLEPEKSRYIEKCKEDLKIVLEKKLFERHREHNKDTWREIASDCTIERLLAPSFQQYRKDMERALKYL